MSCAPPTQLLHLYESFHFWREKHPLLRLGRCKDKHNSLSSQIFRQEKCVKSKKMDKNIKNTSVSACTGTLVEENWSAGRVFANLP